MGTRRAWIQDRVPKLVPALRLVPPVSAVCLLLVALWLLVQSMVLFLTWTGSYGERGEATIGSCQTTDWLLTRQVRCDGDLITEVDRDAAVTAGPEAPEPEGSPVAVIGGPAGFGSAAPAEGIVVEVFFHRGDTGVAYPQQGRSVELARVMFGTVPVAILVVGLSVWLIGWALTRRLAPSELVGHPNQRFLARRFTVRTFGTRWLVAGLLLFAFDRIIVNRLLGPPLLG